VSAISQNRRPTYILIAGVVVALLGAVLVVALVSGSSSGGIAGQTVSVVVAGRDIPARAQVASADLAVVKYPSSSVPGHAFNDMGQVKGYAAVALPKNTPLTSDMLVSAPAAAPASEQGILDVPTGKVAVAIPAGDPINNVAGFVQSGDHVDILVRGLPGQAANQVAATFTDLTIQLVATSSGGGKAPSGNTWVVFVPEDQAMQLVYLFNSGQYTFVLRSRADISKEAPKAGPVGPPEFNGAFGIR
jgi:Flp pilus assembly protein CpaB